MPAMKVTITVPDDLATPLRRVADAQQRTAEAVALDILRADLLDAPDDRVERDLDAAVAAIRATPSHPNVLRPACGSLADALADLVPDEGFDLTDWAAAWSAVEAEMAVLTGADDRAEGRV